MTCRQCAEECSAHRFHENEKVCRRCQKRVRCQVCGKSKRASAFAKQLLANANARCRKTIIRCMSCMTCRRCKLECCASRFHKNKRICKTCSCLNHTCKLCGVPYGSGFFAEEAMKQHIKYHAPLLCQGCLDKGYTPRDMRTYTCVHGCKHGHGKFDPKQLDNHRNRGNTLTCTDCQIRK